MRAGSLGYASTALLSKLGEEGEQIFFLPFSLFFTFVLRFIWLGQMIERERIERSYSGRPPVGTIKQGMKLFNAR